MGEFGKDTLHVLRLMTLPKLQVAVSKGLEQMSARRPSIVTVSRSRGMTLNSIASLSLLLHLTKGDREERIASRM